MNGRRAKIIRKYVRARLEQMRKEQGWNPFRKLPDPMIQFKTVYRRVKKLYNAGIYA